jgi:hypothetical protein
MNRVYKVVCLVGAALFLGACNSGGLFGLVGTEDGTWLFTTNELLASGTSYSVQVSTDRVTGITINNAPWTVTTSFPASRTGSQIQWTTVATSPAGAFGQLTKQFDFDVALQADGTLTGTLTEGLSLIPGVTSVQTAMFPITMTRI